MSDTKRSKRHTIRDLAKGGTPSVWLTAYTAPMARMLDAHVDVLLVGDSLGNAVYGFETTLPVTLEMMIAHGAAVVRGSTNALIVVDMPFGSYQQSPQQAFCSAARILAETGCGAVKLEGGAEMASTVAFLTERGVPVCGHVGLRPQMVRSEGLRAKGRVAAEAEQVMADAQAIAGAGAFALVIEGTYEPLARALTEAVAIPTIGIGASPACDGQVLVIDDVLGLPSGHQPRFVKRYAELGEDIGVAAAAFAEEVRARSFPQLEHCFTQPAPPR